MCFIRLLPVPLHRHWQCHNGSRRFDCRLSIYARVVAAALSWVLTVPYDGEGGVYSAVMTATTAQGGISHDHHTGNGLCVCLCFAIPFLNDSQQQFVAMKGVETARSRCNWITPNSNVIEHRVTLPENAHTWDIWMMIDALDKKMHTATGHWDSTTTTTSTTNISRASRSRCTPNNHSKSRMRDNDSHAPRTAAVRFAHVRIKSEMFRVVRGRNELCISWFCIHSFLAISVCVLFRNNNALQQH